jgi:UDP-GlcNAc:undecaprenyl-phosphate GlcNAc-1-phosphate transferase
VFPNLILVIVGSFLMSMFTVLLVRKVSHRMAWYDRTNQRKVHTGNIPRLGGIGFVVPFMVFFSAAFVVGNFIAPFQFFLLLVAFALILTSGLRDDFKPMAPGFKLVFQTGAAFCVLLSGCVFDRFFLTDHFGFLNSSGWKALRYPLTFLWIVGMINAVNFIDGIDGLAGGVSLLAALGFFGVFVFLGVGGPVLMLCACLASAILGFLVFNAPFPQAKIFMGDGGAYFLGFTLALFPLMGTPAKLPILHAAAILLIPILDATAAVWRRIRDGKRVDSPDRSHTHHKLMSLGFSSRRIDSIFFILQFGLCVLVCASVAIQGYWSLIMLLLAYTAGIGFFTAIHFFYQRKQNIGANL